MEMESSSEIASTSSSCLKKEEDASGSKTPETPSRCKSPGSPIGDDACPICLGAFNDKCAAGSCLHNFCLVCLKEWSKQRPVCPLCKQSFTKILYDIKSETDYKEWEVPITYPLGLNDRGFIEDRVYRSLSEFLDSAHRRFFSYRSTIIGPRRRQGNSSQGNSFNANPLSNLSRGRRDYQPLLDHERGSSLFRLSIYTNNVWIQPMSDITGRFRECNPNLYREQPGLTHRLVPWINRELAALLPPARMGVVLSDIMDLIERYRINSREFRRALRPHLGANTRHFVHEFYNFARSPYDMVGHDAAAQYIPRYFVGDTSGDSDDTDDDEVIEIESDGVVVESEPLDLSSRVAREETIGNDGSVFISSDSENSVNESRNLFDEDTHNPEPPLYLSRISNILPTFLSRSSQDRTPQNLEEPGPSGVSSSGSLSVKREHSDLRNSSESEDCLIVSVLKPKGERTPELINISSNSEGEASDRTHWKKKMSKEIENKHSKGRKKPRLDRTSFSLRFTGTVNCQHGEDHTYCTESASPCNPGSNRTESEDNSLSFRKRTEFRRSQKTQRKRYNIDSDSHTDSTDDYEIKSRKRKAVVKKRPRNSRSRSFSPEASPRKARKDQRSKVKSSSHVTRSMVKASSYDGKSTSSSSSNLSSTNKKHNLKSSKRRRVDSHDKMLRYHPDRSSSSSSSDSSSSSSSTSSSTSSSSTSSSSSSSSCRSSKSSNCASYVSSECDLSSSSSENVANSDSLYHPSISNLSRRKVKKKRPSRTLMKSTSRKSKEVKKKINSPNKNKTKSKRKKIGERNSKKGTSRNH